MRAIAPRVRHVAESATLAINQRARRLRDTGARITHFGFGESPFPVPRPMRDALAAHAGEKAYLPAEGLPALRVAAAGFLNGVWSCAYQPDDIVAPCA